MTIEGIVTSVFHKNGWYRVRLEDGTTVVGFSQFSPVENAQTQFIGEWVTHPKYGKQFEFKTFMSVAQHSDKESTLLWLSGFKGIGPSRAESIYNHFGKETYLTLKNDPSRLLEISGVGQAVVDAVRLQFEEQQYLWSFHAEMGERGLYNVLTTNQISKIYEVFGTESINTVLKYPYRLMKIRGIAFKTADDIARRIAEFKALDTERLVGALNYILREDHNDGHTCSKRWELIQDAADILQETEPLDLVEIYEDALENVLTDLIRTNELAILDRHVYTKRMKDSEDNVVYRLLGIPVSSGIVVSEATELANAAALKMKEAVGIELDDTQKQAIVQAVVSNVSIITGGPGVGKTSLLRSIVELYRGNKRMSLCAPSGRAARRLSDSTDHEASTIHKLLEARICATGGSIFMRNKQNPLACEILICDEATMMDLQLFEALLDALPEDCKIILVGDVDQLPSVGPGCVFKDLIDSNRFSTIRLSKIYRQKAGSSIAELCANIKQGRHPDWGRLNEEGIIPDEVEFVQVEDASKLPMELVNQAVRLLKMGYPQSEVQVVIPQKVGRAGSYITNFYFQRSLGKYTWERDQWVYVGPHLKIGRRSVPKDLIRPKDYKGLSTVELRQMVPLDVLAGPGDVVRQMVNNKNLNVNNGDIGIVEDVYPLHRVMLVRYPFLDELVTYESEHLNELDLAYAINSHVTQGSEYKAVIAAFHTTHYKMLVRNLAYTTVSRAKERLVVCGTKKAVGISVRNNEVAYRNSLLAERLGA